jgi:uncharacterized membrane protein YhaH (DUF805 family)
MGFIIWGAFLIMGASRARFWQAILLSIVAAAVLTAIGAAAIQNDPLCTQVDCSVTGSGLVYNFAMKLVILLFFYGIGRGGSAVVKRLRAIGEPPPLC